MRVRNRGISRRAGIVAIGAAAWLMFVGGPAWSQLLDIERLDPRLEAAMAPEAREHYNVAWQLIDRIAYTLAYDRFERAVQAEPDNYHLRMLTIDLGRYLGRTKFGNDALKYYESVVGHYETLVKQNLTPDQRRQVITQLEGAENDQNARRLLASLAQRDEQRKAQGLEVARDYAQRVYGRQAEKEAAGESATIRAVREALRRPPVEGMSIFDQISAALGGIAPPERGISLPGTGASGDAGAPVTPATTAAPDNIGAPGDIATPADATQKSAIERALTALLGARDRGDAESFAALFTAAAQPLAATITLTPPPAGSSVEIGQSLAEGSRAQVDYTTRTPGQPDRTGVVYFKIESDPWRAHAIKSAGGQYVDLEQPGGAPDQPDPAVVNLFTDATEPPGLAGDPDDIATPAGATQESALQRAVTAMLGARNRQDAAAFAALFTAEAQPLAGTIALSAPPEGSTVEIGQSFAEGSRAQVEYTTRTPGQPDRTVVVYFKIESDPWRAHALKGAGGQYVDLERADAASNEAVVNIFADTSGAPGVADPPRL